MYVYARIHTINTRKHMHWIERRETENRHLKTWSVKKSGRRKQEKAKKRVATPAPVRGVAVIGVCQAGHSRSLIRPYYILTHTRDAPDAGPSARYRYCFPRRMTESRHLITGAGEGVCGPSLPPSIVYPPNPRGIGGRGEGRRRELRRGGAEGGEGMKEEEEKWNKRGKRGQEEKRKGN